ncbi:MAG TPA: AsmA family protein [Candidatus Polarisedimenticolia bacterium]|nr:AsmA family protein [Candidatus Polarisedimenticolia bacterium]
MNRNLKIAAIVVGVLILIVILIPLFIDANAFRPKLESELSDALGRPVKVGNLSLSLFSGAVKADDISIADDPSFSQSAFVQAKSLNVGVELMPLIFSKALNVTELTLNQPQINLVRSQNGEKWNFSSLGSKSSAQPAAGGSSSSNANPNLSVDKLNVRDGELTINRAGSSDQPRVYSKVDITVAKFSFTSPFPFKMTASLPAGGSLKLDGTAGAINAGNAELTPLQAKVTVHQMNLAASGFIDRASGISGVADFDGTISSDGHEAKTSGTLSAEKLQVVRKGSPAGKPLQLKYAVAHDLVKQVGTLTEGDVTVGKAVAHLSGSYDTRGTTTAVNLKLDGQGMPVDDLEAVLPAVGVILPPRSQLKGGTLAVNFSIVGPVDKLVETGTIRMQNSALSGFSLGSKMSAISALGGKGTGANDTTIQNFSADVHATPESTRADNINLTVPSLATVTGAGTVSASNALDFKMKADAIPFLIQGTTADPKFVPDVKGIAGSMLNNALGGNKSGAKNPLSGVSGLLGKKPQ